MVQVVNFLEAVYYSFHKKSSQLCTSKMIFEHQNIYIFPLKQIDNVGILLRLLFLKGKVFEDTWALSSISMYNVADMAQTEKDNKKHDSDCLERKQES